MCFIFLSHITYNHIDVSRTLKENLNVTAEQILYRYSLA